MSLSIGLSLNTADGMSGARIQLSNDAIADGATVGTIVGALSVFSGTGDYTLSITDDPDDVFDIDGTNIITTAVMDFDTAGTHAVTVQASNGVDDPISRSFMIIVAQAT